jgi:hypothetical protein
MENLEKQLIKRLNKVLNRYNLEIISKNNHNYKTTISVVDDAFKKYYFKYVLVKIAEIDNDITITECYRSWDNIEFMLLNSDCNYTIFNLINIAHANIKLHKDKGLEPYGSYMLLDKVYNELHFLNGCSCLEELIIKIDLMGI